MNTRERLIEALELHELSNGGRGGVLCRCGWADRGREHPAHRVDALMPLVEELARERAATELEAMADLHDQLYRVAEAEWRDEPPTQAKATALGRNISNRRAAIRLGDRAAALRAGT